MKRIFVMAILCIIGSAPSGLSAAQEPRVPASQAAIVIVDTIEDLYFRTHESEEEIWALHRMANETASNTDTTALLYFLDRMKKEEGQVYLRAPTPANNSRFLATGFAFADARHFWSQGHKSKLDPNRF
jgi:hypothetical protein